MQQAKIYWDLENYVQVEKLFRKSVEFCNEHDVWKLNVAHVLFMQDGKWKEATGFYEPIVRKHYDNVCVSYLLLMNIHWYMYSNFMSVTDEPSRVKDERKANKWLATVPYDFM